MSGDVTLMPLGPGAQERVHALVRTIKRGQVQSCNPAESHVMDAHVRRAVHGEETCLRTVAHCGCFGLCNSCIGGRAANSEPQRVASTYAGPGRQGGCNSFYSPPDARLWIW